jgi:hypothetical protein
MNQESYKNLVLLLKIFKNRPHHLAKYLIENSSLNEEFLIKISNSEKLNDISNECQSETLPMPYFVDITQMNDYYTSMLDSKVKENEELLKELSIKLEECILKENYEEAARIRDYIIRNGIKKKK